MLTLWVSAAQAQSLTQKLTPPSNSTLQRWSLAPLVKKASPAVVNIYARKVVRETPVLFADPFFQQFFGNIPSRERVENSLGSGVIVDSLGTVVTNNHVVGASEDIKVVLADRREFTAKVLYTDKRTDLAVLAMETKGERFPFVPLGDSESLEVGDMLLAIGNPFGVGQTVTSGIVSALARTGVGIADYNFFIQTDAAINPGNSGGALVAMDGTLVGINTAIFSKDGGSNGIGFAIPATMVRTVLTAARNGGKSVRAWLGASGQTVTPALAETLALPRPIGVLLGDVPEGSPAAKAGLMVGDVLLTWQSKEITDADALRFRLATTTPNTVVNLGFWRSSGPRQTVVTLTTPPETPARSITLLTGEHPLNGITVANLNPAFADELGLTPSAKGVIVTEIKGNSFARQMGLLPADILLAINGNKVRDVTGLQKLLGQTAGVWKLSIGRAGKTLNVEIRR